MSGSAGSPLFATICNTVGEASAYALWFTHGGKQFVADLSGHLGGAGGLTGIAFHDGLLYLAVQSHAARILVLDMTLNVIDTITHEGFNDLHSLHVVGDTLLIVSARTGTLFRRDLKTGETAAHIRFDPRVWVCDVLCVPDDIWLCCHNLSHFVPDAIGGGVFSVKERRVVLDGLSGPHSLIPYRDRYVILDSANARLMFFQPGGEIRVVQLQGFLRGALVSGDDSLLVAGGPDRTISRKNPEGDGARGLRQVLDERLRIFEVKQSAPPRIVLPECPGFEIYDLFAIPASAGFRPAAERIIPAEQGLFARYYYTSLITAHVRAAEGGS
jgi:WD40 repeat protein